MKEKSYESFYSSSILKVDFIDCIDYKNASIHTLDAFIIISNVSSSYDYDENAIPNLDEDQPKDDEYLNYLEEKFSKSAHMKFCSNKFAYDGHRANSWEGSLGDKEKLQE
jgi:hypothetical protein